MLENERGFVARVGNDESIALALKPKNSAVSSVTSIVVTAATNIVATVVDTAGVTQAKTYAFATFDTVGKVADAIRGDGYFDVEVLDCLRSEASVNNFNTSLDTTTLPGSHCITLNTASIDKVFLKVSTKRLPLFAGPFAGLQIDLKEVKFLVDTAANGVVAYFYAVKGTSETLIYKTSPAVADTETTVNFASGEGKLSVPVGYDLLVKLDSGDAVTETATNYLAVVANVGSIRK